MKKKYLAPEVLVIKTHATLSLLSGSPTEAPQLEETEDASVDKEGFYYTL